MTNSSREVLPINVKPTNYTVEIIPGLESFKFTGIAAIELVVHSATMSIVANAHELIITSASVSVGSKVIHAQVSSQEAAQTVTFDLQEEVAQGVNAILNCTFEGTHNDQMAGFYRSGYTDEAGAKKHLVVTQFEATDARRCFPCWDEPNIKATFDIILSVPKDRIALSNMPVISESTVNHNGITLKRVAFAKTPMMSTYLVAMAVGEFDYIESVAKPKSPVGSAAITCRVYTLKGQTDMGKFGLEMCTRTLEYFSEYFDMAYPLPKMDMIAIPDFGAGAMENWGLVTYRETALLYDPVKSSAAAKERVAYVVAHELAHQWFGNIVTMDWWKELWLNEGFATYVGWLAVDQSFPEWEVFTSFVNSEFARGIGLDSMRSSHPIEVEVQSPSEVAQIFDAISYSKGASIIRMISNYLGGKVFQKGVNDYLKRHAYGNATTIDLWTSLGVASKQNVTNIMHSWTRDMGFPLVTVEEEIYDPRQKTMTLKLSQQKFLATGDLTAAEDAASPIWSIPIAILTNSKNVTIHLMTQKTGSIVFPFEEGVNSFYKLNTGVSGFYRVKYCKQGLERLEAALVNRFEDFSTVDKIGIIADSFALARAGKTSTDQSLELLTKFEREEDERVLTEISSRFGALEHVWFQNESVLNALKVLKAKIFSAKAQKLGLDYAEDDAYLTVLKRTLVVRMAAEAGDEKIIADIQDRFNRFVSGDTKAIHPNLRGTVFKTVLNHSTNAQEDFDAVLKVYKTGSTVDERMSALGAIGATNSLDIARKVLYELTFDENLIKLQDIMYPVSSLATSNPHKVQVLEMLWVWLQEKWPLLHKRLSPTLSLLSRVVSFSIDSNVGDDIATEVENWATGAGLSETEKALRVKQVKDAQRPLDQSLEKIHMSTKWLTRDDVVVNVWLSTKGYLAH